jgi:ATP-binding cassette subfamily B protein
MKEEKKGAVFRVFQRAKCKKGHYITGVTFASLGILLSAVPFYCIYRIVEIFLIASLNQVAPDTNLAWWWAGITALSIGLGITLSIIGSGLCHISAFDALFDLRMRILEHMGKLSLGYFTRSRSGAVQKMMNDNVGKMEEIIAHSFPNIIGAALVLIALAVLMFSINVVLAITVFGALIIAFIIQFSAFGGKKGQKAWTDLHGSSTELEAAFSEYIMGMEEEKIFGNPKSAAKRLTEIIMKNRTHMLNYLKRTSPIFGAFKVITLSLLGFILAAGSILLYFDRGNHNLIMQILMFLIVAPSVVNPLMELVELGADLKNLAARMDQIDEVFKLRPMQDGIKKFTSDKATVVFDNVSFSYENPADPLRRMALDHVSLELPAGSFTALVGPSGGGKSTVGQLLARFWDVESGAITINHIDIRDFKINNLTDKIAFVFQDTYIFSESVYDNIAMHREVTKKEVERAAKAARCHDFIMSLPNGYDTKLGDGGHKLSGGEAQRIAIARAILKNAPIVVLDEAMAFTDAENELALREAMVELLHDKTVLMIAHRLYSIKDADNIYVMENGKIAEGGKHHELLTKNGVYARLWHIQNETENWHMKGSEAYV